MRWRVVIVLFILTAAGAVAYFGGWHDRSYRSGDPRYDEIAAMIDDNLHWGRHFTRAVTAETIAETRHRLIPADIPALIRMLGDERGTAAAAAGGLLATFGETARPALESAAGSADWRIAMGARDALSTIDRCRDNPAGTNPAVCPR